MDELYNLVTAPKTCSDAKWGCGILLQDPVSKKILVARRTDLDNPYCSTGGHVEYQESPMEAILRETLEESNVKINSMKFFDYLQHGSPSGENWTDFCFYSDDFDASNIQNQETEMNEFEWYDEDELDNLNLFEPFKLLLDSARAKGILRNSSSGHFIPFVECPTSGFSAKDVCSCAYSYTQPEEVFVNNQGFYWD